MSDSKKTANARFSPGIKFVDLDVVIGAALVVVAGIMPLVLRAAIRPMPPELVPLFRAEHFRDFSSYWKGWLVMAPAIAIAFFFANDWVARRRLPDFGALLRRPQVAISLVYLAFVLISAAASPFVHTSWLGTFQRHEGAFMWMAYFTVFFAAMHFAQEPRHAKIILGALVFSSLVMGAIALGQFMGHNFFATRLGGWLVTAGTPVPGIRPRSLGAYGTLVNSNTFGKYAATLAPVLLLGALAYEGRKIARLLMLTAGILMLLGVFGSRSLGGLAGAVAGAGALAGAYAFCLLRGRKRKCASAAWRLFDRRLALAAGGLLGAFALSAALIPGLNARAALLFGRLGDAARAEAGAGRSYVFEGSAMHVYRGPDRVASLALRGLGGREWLAVLDGGGREVPYRLEETADARQRLAGYVFDVPGFGPLGVCVYPRHFAFHYGGSRWPFRITLHEGRVFGMSPGGELVDLAEEIPARGFRGRERWGSARGYIWSRSLPLMPSRVFLGSGPDAFVNVFPQHDMVGKRLFLGNPHMIVDKAHNLFIQTWIATGGLSAIALFALFGHFILSTLLSLSKAEREPCFSFGLRLGLLSGASAFCVASMATDSTVGSTGVFFVLLGLGYGMNALAAAGAAGGGPRVLPREGPAG